MIPKFVDALQRNEPPTIHGDGGQTRDFTYVANAVSANLLAAKNAERASGEIINVACGDRVSINDLYFAIAEHLGSDLKPIYGEPRLGDVRDSLADIDKGKSLIDYVPLVDYKDGLGRTVAWYQS